ncbi:MAG TPA: aromatic-ring-hydroxylating dioxygenase subunit beta [Steroidobacteraceae bacterium]|nr:aromatic-ring-hydroxylating dioxygenase subunit beta [Steroidobacteraceae bacterium]
MSTTSKLEQRLLEDVVIFENKEAQKTGAQSIAPDHSPRQALKGKPLPARSALTETQTAASLQQHVEQFLFHQSELLDEKQWAAYIELFTTDGVYWMPVTPDQTEWLDSPSIFAEDRQMMEIRMGRVTHPNAWSQAPQWGTSHLVGNVVIESVSDTEVSVRSRFQMMELRRDTTRHFAGTYRHTLRRVGDDFKIVLQRVDLLNGQAPFDYVLQIWV